MKDKPGIAAGRRPSTHFVPTARAKKKGKQLQFETEWTKERIEANPVVDRIRQRVGDWRRGGYVGVTGVTSRLLAYWTRNDRDRFLIVTPGITIRDRLRVLLPTDPDNYYRQRDVLPSDLLERLAQTRILITNYHAFLPRERGDAARLTKLDPDEG